ncbi:hypothetical protein ACDT12_13595, partial [Staphylococcus aureus]
AIDLYYDGLTILNASSKSMSIFIIRTDDVGKRRLDVIDICGARPLEGGQIVSKPPQLLRQSIDLLCIPGKMKIIHFQSFLFRYLK